MKKITIMDTIILLIAVALVVFTLMPAVARIQRSSAEAKCQSNMRRWAQAMAMYTTENGNRYPTNRAKKTMSGGVPLAAAVKLSPMGIDTATGKPYRGKSGTVCWVEALYPYLIDVAQKTGQDWMSFMKCPIAANVAAPAPTGTMPSTYVPGISVASALTYTLNYNLVEQPKWAVRNPEKLMMLREMDRLVDSILRPTNMSNGTIKPAPESPFLSTSDSNKCVGVTSMPFVTFPRLHGNGSHIVFADGHVRYFDASYYPNTLTSNSWDADAQQWYNYVYTNPSTDAERALDRSIAITL